MWLQFSGFKGLESTSLGRTIKGTSTFSHIHSSYVSKFSTNASWPAIRASYTFLTHAEVETFVAAVFAAFATFFPPGGCKATQYIVKSLNGSFLCENVFKLSTFVKQFHIREWTIPLVLSSLPVAWWCQEWWVVFWHQKSYLNHNCMPDPLSWESFMISHKSFPAIVPLQLITVNLCFQ